jgi:crotonobetainyl-CoA:carnitine CoA-transferase CaiB-like acyl-CoA transferase
MVVCAMLGPMSEEIDADEEHGEDAEGRVERPGALAGLRVLELGEETAAPYCSKLLGDLGADVIKIERPEGGDPSRQHGRSPTGEPDPERSAAFLYLNSSKRSVRLDLSSDAGRRELAQLAAWADVLIEDRAPGELASLGLGYDTLSRANPALVMTSITPFGQTGPNAGHRSRHLNLYHGAGHASPFALIDDEERAPAVAGGEVGEYDAGLTAALGTLAALYGRDRTGRGEHIDCSKQEAMMCLERVTIGRYANEPDPFSGGGPGGLSRAKDGWVMLTTLELHQWEGMLRAMGSPAWAQAEWCKTPEGRMQHMDEIGRRKDEWGDELTREEIYHAAQLEGTPAAPVRNVAEVLDWKQLQARSFFRDIDHPRAGRLSVPTAPFSMSQTAWVGRRAPLLGEHDDEVRASVQARPAAATPASQSNGRGPLAGIRIADFTWAWAGPQGSLLLGMLGAEVIKIESRSRLDHSRVHSLTAGSLGGSIDESPVFNDLNLGKRSVTLNLRSEGGRDLAKQLVSKSDIVLQNMRPGVLDRLGLGYSDLRQVRPDVIMLSSSAVGASGPEGSYAGYAPTFACLSGIASISGYPDEPPSALSGSVDLRVGTAAAFAVMAALHHRRRTGEGQNIDLSSTEVMSVMMGHAFLDYQLTQVIPERMGNRHASMAPHGCFRCRDVGDSRIWATIAVASDAEFTALRGVLNDAELDAADFATAGARKQNEDRLDQCIERWTREHLVEEVVDRLQAAGIAAARLHTGASLACDPHLLAREAYVPVKHPLLGEIRSVRPPWRMHGAKIDAPGPLLGQHNDYVLREILGLGREEIDALVETKAVY